MFVVCACAEDSSSKSEDTDGVGAGGTSSATATDSGDGTSGAGTNTGASGTATSDDTSAGSGSTGGATSNDRDSDSPGMPADTTTSGGAGGNSGQAPGGTGGSGGDSTSDGAGGGAGNDPSDGTADDAMMDDGAADDGAGGGAADDSTDTGAGGMMGADDGGEPGAGGMMGADDDATPDTAEPRCPAEMTEASKTVVRDGITEVFINGNGAVIDDYWADPYIQHNPAATSGVDTFKGFFANVSPGFYSLTRLIGECDLVLIHGSYGSGGTFDMLRVDQEKMRMVEHWDAGMSGNDLLGGPTEVTDLELTEANRSVVIGFTEEVMIGGNTDATSTYLAAEVTEHGADPFPQRLSAGDSYTTIHHQIAEGNFVFTLSEGVTGGTATGFWDLYRVDGGLIVEHWGATLRVQAGASGEGIF